MEYVPLTSGVRLAADRHPGGRDTPVVLLHGGGQTRHAWAATARTLAAHGWPVLAADLRGHGDSEWSPGGDYSVDLFAADVAALAAACPAPPVLVGASLGGLSSLLAVTAQPPAPAAGLVLVDVAHRFERDGARRIVEFMSAAPDGFETPGQVAEAVAAYLPHRQQPAGAGLRRNLRRRGGRWQWHWDPALLRMSPDLLDERTGDAWQRRLAARLARLSLPALLIRGAASDVVSRDIAAEFARLAPGAETVDVAGARHMVAGDSNAAFTAALLGFLERRFACAP